MRAIQRYQAVVAAVQAAAVAARTSGRRWRRRPVDVGRFARRRRCRPRVALPAPAGPRPSCLHALYIDSGPPLQPQSRIARRAPPHCKWTLRCAVCGKKAGHTRGWRRLACSLCPHSPDFVSHTQERRRHELVRCARGWECVACGLSGTSSQRGVMARSGCPAHRVLGPTGEQVPGALVWRRYDVRLAAAWRAWADGAVGTEDLVQPADRQLVVDGGTPQCRSVVLRWRSHWIIRSGGRAMCVRCGRGPFKAQRSPLEYTPCPGVKPLRPAGKIALASYFRVALERAPPLWQSKVEGELHAI